jgi:hypothetical protein
MLSGEIVTREATFATSAVYSTPVDVPRAQHLIVWCPPGWTAANMTFQFAYVPSPDTGDWYEWADTSAVVVYPAAAGRVISANDVILPGITRIPQDDVAISKMRIVSGTSASPVQQAAERTVKLGFWCLD